MPDVSLAYPLQWPHGRRRTPADEQRRGRFGYRKSEYDLQPVSWAMAVHRLEVQLDAIKAVRWVLTTDRQLRRDGAPRADRPVDPADPGAAVYFRLGDKPMCLPCDTYLRLPDNIAAIAAHIEATRAIERHGVASIEEMFAGFLALPAPDQARPWREVLELHRQPRVTVEDVESAYRRLARERHPDTGGTDAMMAELNRARDDARREVNNS